MLNDGLMSSERGSWNTPENVLAVVRETAPIGLDPCGNATSIVSAAKEYRLDRGEDGLSLPWVGHGLVYCNPPYGRGIGLWIARGCEADSAILLVPARTDTAWWKLATTADAICFWYGRLKFLGAASSAPFPSALLYWGPRVSRFDLAAKGSGWVVRP